MLDNNNNKNYGSKRERLRNRFLNTIFPFILSFHTLFFCYVILANLHEIDLENVLCDDGVGISFFERKKGAKHNPNTQQHKQPHNQPLQINLKEDISDASL